MLKQSENAIGMLISKYRSVLKKMFVKNAAVLAAASCMLFTAAPAMAATTHYVGTYWDYKNFEELRNANVLQDGDTVVVYSVTDGDSSLKDSLILDGKSVTFNFRNDIDIKPGNNKDFSFIAGFDGANVTLIAENGAKVTISGFTGNDHGSVIYSENDVAVKGSITFRGNFAEDNGGVIYSKGNVNINGDITFDGNKAENPGGVIYTQKTVNIYGSNTFNANYSGEAGGAIHSAGTVTIAGSGNTFSGNHSKQDGGAIFSGDKEYSSDLFCRVYIKGDNNIFSGNYTENNNASGGAIYARDSVTVSGDNNLFSSNTAGASGGAIFSRGDVTVDGKGNTFDNNKVEGSQKGGAIYSGADVTIKGENKFTNNMADGSGATEGHGGAIYSGYSTYVEGSNIFTANNADGGDGGAIYSASSTYVKGSNVFEGNLSSDTGGAIYSKNTIFIEGSKDTGGNVFTGNYAIDKGGAIRGESTITISGKNTFKNHESEVGGAIYSTDDTVIKDDNIFEYNRAENPGGAIFSEKNVTVSGSNSFKYNSTTKKDGGAIHSAGTVTIKGSNKFVDNAAEETSYNGAIHDYGACGGAVYSGDQSFGSGLAYNIVVDGSNSFKSNSSGAFGGALYADKNVDVSGSNSFTSNSASGLHGGAIYAENDVSISGSNSFGSNFSGFFGGAIFAENRVSVFDSNTFNDNRAASCGGAIYAEGSVIVNGSNTFTKNYVGINSGGAIFAHGDVNIIGTNTFSGNSAETEGGAIKAGEVYTDNLNKYDCLVSVNGTNTFRDNYAGTLGGAILAEGSVKVYGSSTFVNNKAESAGGAIYAVHLTLNAYNGDITFQGNTEAGVPNAVFLRKFSSKVLGEPNIENCFVELSAAAGSSIFLYDPIRTSDNYSDGNVTIDINKSSQGSQYPGTILFDKHLSYVARSNTTVYNGTIKLTNGAGYQSYTFTLGDSANPGTKATLASDAHGNYITANNITINGNNVLVFDMNGATDTTVNLKLQGTNFSGQAVGTGTIDIFSSTPLPQGSYTLVESTAAQFGNSGVIRYNGTTKIEESRYLTALSLNAEDDSLQLQVNKMKNTELTWTGKKFKWENLGTAGWTGKLDGENVTQFVDGDTVIFGNKNTNPIDVDEAGVTVKDMKTSNSAGKDYIFSGGSISGDNLIINGTGNITLNTVNNFNTLSMNNGSLNLNYANNFNNIDFFNGRIYIRNNQALGTETINMSKNFSDEATLGFYSSYSINNNINIGSGTAVFETAAGTDATITGSIDGVSQSIFKKTGAGTLTVGKTLADDVNVTEGTLKLAAGKSLTATGSLDVANGATLSITAEDNAHVYADKVDFHESGRLNVNGYNFSNGLPASTVTLIKSYNVINKPTNYTFAGMDKDIIDFLSVQIDENQDNDIVMEIGLTWYDESKDGDDNYKAHGTFTLENENGSFTVGTKLTDRTDDKYDPAKWDGKTLTKDGDGTLILTGDNDYTGGTELNAGRIDAGSNTALGDKDESVLIMQGGTTLGFAAEGLSIENKIKLDGSAAVDTAGYNGTLSGAIDGGGSLTKTGEGTLTLDNAANSYTGGTIIKQGELVTGKTVALGSGPVQNNAVLTFEGASGNFGNKLSGSGTVNIRNKGAAKSNVTFSENNTAFTGTINLNSGQVNIAADNALGTGGINMSGDTVLGFTNSSSISNSINITGGVKIDVSGENDSGVISGTISGGGGLTKEGDGELILANANTYEGGTNIGVGNLIAKDKNSLGTGTVSIDNEASLILAFDGEFKNQLKSNGELHLNGETDGKIEINQSNSEFKGEVFIDSGRVDIGNNFSLGDGGRLTMKDGTTLGFNDNITLENNITLNNGSATFDTKDNAVTLSDTIDGSGGLTKTGAGTLTLSNTSSDNPNTYTGGTNIKEGTLIAQSSTALGETDPADPGKSQVEIQQDAALTLAFSGDENNYQLFNYQLSGDGTLNINGNYLEINNANADFKGTANLSGGNTLKIGDNDSLGTANLKMGADSVLKFADGYTGGYSLGNNITLALGGATVDTGTNDVSLNGTISSLGGLTKKGRGNLALTFSNTYWGGTTISDGTLTAIIQNALGKGKVDVADNAALNLGFSGTFDNRLSGEGDLNIDSGSGAITFTRANIGFTGDTTIATGSSVNIGNHFALGRGNKLTMEDETSLGFTGSYVLGNDITINGDAALDVDGGFKGVLIHGINGGDLTKTGAGTLTLGDDSGIDNVTLTEGALDIAAGKILDVNGTATLEDYTTLGVGANLALKAGEVTINGDNVTIDVNSYIGSLAPITLIESKTAIEGDFGKIIIGGAEIKQDISLDSFISGATLGKANEDKEIRVDLGGLVWNNIIKNTAHGTFNVLTNFDLKANLSDNEDAKNGNAGFDGWDGQTLTKTGAGTLILSGTNTYKGATNINEGILTLKAGDSIASVSQITLGTDKNAATLQLDYAAVGNLNNGVTIAKSGGIIGVAGKNVTLKGVIDGNGVLVKDGEGELILTNADNAYQGGTYIAAGTLTAEHQDALSTGTVYIQEDAALTLSFNEEFKNNLSGGGGLNIDGDVIINRANGEFTGATSIITDNTLTIGNALALGTGSLTMNDNTTLGFNDSLAFYNNITLNGGATISTASNGSGNTVLLNGTITGTVGLTKDGAGKLILAESNTYTGGTNIKTGELTALNQEALGADKVTVQKNAALNLAFNGEFKNELEGETNSTLNINGKVTVKEANSGFKGKTNLSSDSTVKIGHEDALGDGDINMAASSTLSFINNSSLYSLGNNITIAFGGAAVNTAGNNAALTGIITGLGGLTKDGAGELFLTNADNDYKGGTTISGGSLTATGEDVLGSGKVEVQSGAELNLEFNGDFNNRLSGGGDLTIYSDGGAITFTKANIGFFGDTTIESGRVNIGNYLALGTGGITMNDGTALGFNDSYTLRNKITLNGGATFDTDGNDIKLTGTIGGDGGLIKDGEGSLTLTSANTYEGGTIIKDGTLIAQNATALGIDYVKIGGNTLTLEFDGEFKNELSGTGELNIDGTVTIKTTNDNFAGTTNILSGKTLNIGDDEVLGTSDIKMSASSTLGFNGDYSLGNNINIAFGGAAVNTAGNKATLAGKITGLGSLTKEGAGTLTVTGDSTDGINDYQGGTTINGGTLTATDKNALGTGKVEVAKDATLNLKFDGTFANRLTGEGNLNITSNTGAIKFTKINIGFSGNTVLTEGSSVKIDNHLALGTGSLTMEDDTTLGFTGNYLLGNDITIEGAVEIAVDSGVTSTLIHGINSDDTNGGDLTKTGAGTLTLGDDSSLHNVTLEDGTLRIAADKTLTVTNTATLGNGTNDTTLSVGANLALTAEAVDIANNVTIDINSYNMDDGSGIVLIKADAITGKFNDIFYIGGVEVTTDAPDIEKFIYGTSILYDNDAQGDDTVLLKVVGGLAWNRPEEDSAHGTFNVATSFDLKTNLTDNKNTENYYTDPSGNIWDGKTLTKTGDGTLILSGTNTYEGATNINKGTLTLKADDSILSSSQINLGTDTTSATLQLDYTAAGTLGNNITISKEGGTIDVTGKTVTLNGVIDSVDSSDGLTKDGAGKLVLTNANTYEGGTTIKEGTLVATDKDALGKLDQVEPDKSQVQIQQDAALTLAFNDEFKYQLSGGGTLNIDGTVDINTTNDYFKGTTNIFSRQTLNLGGNGNALGTTGEINMADYSTLGFKDNYSLTNNITNNYYAFVDTANHLVSLEGTIIGTGILAKTGGGELVLTNANNTYSGGTYIAAGELTATNASALGTGAVLNDAALNLQYTGEFKNNLYGDGNLNIDGKIAIKQNNSGFSGITTLNANSAVQIGNYYALGTGGITMNNETTLGFSGNYFLDNNITLNGTATVNTAGHNAALTGTIGGDGGLTKDGDGELILDKANTYQGGTTIKAGTLTATNVKALGDNENGSVVLVDNDATLNFDLNFRQSGSVNNKITGSGDLVKSGNGILTLTNTGSDYSNLKTVVNDGLLRITADETNQLKLGAVENKAQLNFVSSQNFTEKAITIGTYSGSGTLGLQASITSAEGQWSDYVTFATAPLESVNVHFYFEPGSRLRYMPVAGLPFAPLNADDGNYNKFSLDSAFSMAGVYLLSIKPGEGEYSDDYVLTSVFAPGQAKVYSEVAAATMAQASGMHGRDLLDATSRAAKSASGNNTGIYAGFGRTDARYKTGSHADVDGNTLSVALAWQANEKTAWGIFGQMFDGNYTTSHEGLVRTINSNGKLKAHDVGLFAEYRPSGKSDTGHYYKAIVRAGRSSNDFRADNYQNTISTFQSGRNVFGFSLGGGYVKNSGQDKSVEYYSHLIYTRLGGNTTTDSVGQDISFNSDESVRLLAGTRLNLAQNKKTGVYLGAALDYEFRGRTNAYINGYKADSADLKGLTGIFELGLSSKQSKTLTIDCGLQGYVGKKKGLGGTLTVSKKF